MYIRERMIEYTQMFFVEYENEMPIWFVNIMNNLNRDTPELIHQNKEEF